MHKHAEEATKPQQCEEHLSYRSTVPHYANENSSKSTEAINT